MGGQAGEEGAGGLPAKPADDGLRGPEGACAELREADGVAGNVEDRLEDFRGDFFPMGGEWLQ